MEQNYYEILEIVETATIEEIERAYKSLVFIWHPDRNNGSKTSELRTQEIIESYEVLSDPEKRKRYDLKLKWRRDGQNHSKTTSEASQNHKSTKSYSSNNEPKRFRIRYTSKPLLDDSKVKVIAVVVATVSVIGYIVWVSRKKKSKANPVNKS